MPAPAKPCEGHFSEETVRTLEENLNRAQWMAHPCETCGQLVEARLVKGHWTPDPHWPSIPKRRDGKAPARASAAKQRMLAENGTLPTLNAAPGSDLSEAERAFAAALAGSPQSRPPARSRSQAIGKPAVPATAIKRIFVVDDEFSIASSLSLILRHHGFDATSFSNPLEALRAAKERMPHVLVSDIMMPELSGIELATRVQECSPECKVLLFSGQASTHALLAGAEGDGQRFELLAKPVHPAELIQRIRQLLEDPQAAQPAALAHDADRVSR